MADRIFKLTFLGDASKALHEMDKLGGAFTKAGSTLTRGGAALTAGLTVPIIGAATAAITSAVSFESAFAGVRKTVDGTEEEFKALRTGILDMSEAMPQSAADIARVVEAAGALGISKGSLLDFAKVAVGMGVATDLSADDAATAMAKIANVTQMPEENFSRLGAAIVALGNDGASTEAEIAAMAMRIAAAGHTVGLSVPEILGFAGGLSSMGLEAEGGGTAISRVFVNIADAVAEGGDELSAFAKVSGLSTADFAAAFKDDAAGATITFIEGLRRIQDEGGNVFAVLEELSLDEIRVRDALLRAAGAGGLLREQVALGNSAWEENIALMREVDERNKTTEAQWLMLQNQLKRVAIDLGTVLLPVVRDLIEIGKPMIEFLARGVEWFSKLPEPVRNTALVILAVVAAIGPLLIFGGMVATAIGALVPLFAAVGVAGLALLGPIGLIAVAIGGLVLAGIALWQNWDTVMAKWREFKAAIGLGGPSHDESITHPINPETGAPFGADFNFPIPGHTPGATSGRSNVMEFDSGGVIPGPTGAPRLVMAHAGETILPTHKGGAWGGITMNFYAPIGASSAEMQRIVVQALNDMQSRLGGTGYSAA